MMKRIKHILIVIGILKYSTLLSFAQTSNCRTLLQHKEKNKEIIEYSTAKDALKKALNSSIVTLVSGKEQISEPMLLTKPMIIESKGGSLLLGGPNKEANNIITTNEKIAPTIAMSNYPNPFKQQTIFRYELPFNAKVTIDIYDIAGRKIVTLVDKEEKSGERKLIWNVQDKYGKQLSPGMYISILSFENHKETHRIVLE